MEYLITPPEATDWRIDAEVFKENLVNNWSNLSLNPIVNAEDYYCLEWVIMPPRCQQRLDGALHRDRQGISLDGSLEDCAKFALWFRDFVPSNQALFFYDHGYNYHIDLQKNITNVEIINTFSSLIMISSK
jgi:hypothetical protein